MFKVSCWALVGCCEEALEQSHHGYFVEVVVQGLAFEVFWVHRLVFTARSLWRWAWSCSFWALLEEGCDIFLCDG